MVWVRTLPALSYHSFSNKWTGKVMKRWVPLIRRSWLNIICNKRCQIICNCFNTNWPPPSVKLRKRSHHIMPSSFTLKYSIKPLAFSYFFFYYLFIFVFILSLSLSLSLSWEIDADDISKSWFSRVTISWFKAVSAYVISSSLV
jgi:hypothetical protein